MLMKRRMKKEMEKRGSWRERASDRFICPPGCDVASDYSGSCKPSTGTVCVSHIRTVGLINRDTMSYSVHIGPNMKNRCGINPYNKTHASIHLVTHEKCCSADT